MTEQGATSQSTGSLHPHDPSPETPHRYQVSNPTAADIANAANKDTYPRLFYLNAMVAYLEYHKHYRPEGQFHKYVPDTMFVGNRNLKYRNPPYHLTGRGVGLEAFREWWCDLPNTIPERKYLHGQMRDVISALSLDDIPLALALLEDINLAVSPDTSVAGHVKRDLTKALEGAMFPEMWDFMNPSTRPPIPWEPKAPTSSGTTSGTSISGTTITVSTA